MLKDQDDFVKKEYIAFDYREDTYNGDGRLAFKARNGVGKNLPAEAIKFTNSCDDKTWTLYVQVVDPILPADDKFLP